MTADGDAGSSREGTPGSAECDRAAGDQERISTSDGFSTKGESVGNEKDNQRSQLDGAGAQGTRPYGRWRLVLISGNPALTAGIGLVLDHRGLVRGTLQEGGHAHDEYPAPRVGYVSGIVFLAGYLRVVPPPGEAMPSIGDCACPVPRATVWRYGPPFLPCPGCRATGIP